MSTDGATPKVTRSARLSSSMPKRLLVFVNLATKPSKTSKIIDGVDAHDKVAGRDKVGKNVDLLPHFVLHLVSQISFHDSIILP